MASAPSASKAVPVILCGGTGSRLWPISRESCPKQFLRIFFDGPSSLQQAVLRTTGSDLFDRPIVMTIEPYRFLVRQQLEEIGCEAEIVLEPERRESGPSILAAALLVAPDRLLFVSAADHLIEDSATFLADVGLALRPAAAGKLVTFGVTPTRNSSSYGYIQPGDPIADLDNVSRVERFVEKPDHETAERLVAAGSLWNSGNFVFRAASIISEYEEVDASSVHAVRQSIANAKRDLGFLRLDPTAFAGAGSRSIDYAVMEHTERAAVVRARFDWCDLGDWEAVWSRLKRDRNGNAYLGTTELLDSRDTLVIADLGMAAVADVKDLVVIATSDAVLVADRKRPERVRELAMQVKAKGHRQGIEHRRIYRPWGWYQTVDSGPRFHVKRIAVRPGARLSLQRHYHRAEHWVVVRGTAEVTVGEEIRTLSENQSTYIPIGSIHRLGNPGKIELELIEVQTGSYFGEDDIIRIEDDFLRSKQE